MPSTIGPLLSFEAVAPPEWNTRLEGNTLQLKDQSGYGWSVEVYNGVLKQKLLQLPEPTRIFVAQVLREDAESIFAFDSLAERAVFMELRELDSIGPKIAALILANIPAGELEKMATGELKQVPRKIPGLGPKMQEKLTLGLRQRRDAFLELLHGMQPVGSATQRTLSFKSPSATRGFSVPHDVAQTMEALGLRATDTESIWQTLTTEDSSFESKTNSEIIKRILQEWGRHKSRPRNMGSNPPEELKPS